MTWECKEIARELVGNIDPKGAPVTAYQTGCFDTLQEMGQKEPKRWREALFGVFVRMLPGIQNDEVSISACQPDDRWNSNIRNHLAREMIVYVYIPGMCKEQTEHAEHICKYILERNTDLWHIMCVD